ncbi:MAG TPA: hypothetical protein VNJ03_17305 [Vicinamibacterales bacterium]|nr:hypothetical protein [Vicinamibacterales bacterium]
MIMHPDMREVRGHALDRPRARELEKLAVAGRVELEHGGSELKALRPLRPAARLVDTVDREDGSARLTGPRGFERMDLACRDVEHAVDGRHEVARRPHAIELHHEAVTAAHHI